MKKNILLILFGKLYKIIACFIAIPVVLFARILRPLIVVRFGPLWSTRIGHFLGNTEIYLCERDAGMHGQRTFDIFYHTYPVCNSQAKKMWDRALRVFSFARWIDRLNCLIPGGERHMIRWRQDQERDIHCLLSGTRPHISFTAEEERSGEREMRNLGMTTGAPFVCFLSRNSAYLDKVFPKDKWDYHSYRDSDVKNFLPAAEELTRRGYFTLRMGAIIDKPLGNANSRIIDYAAKHRTDFLDMFLGAKCSFYIGDSCGFYDIPMVFRRPLAVVNLIPLEDAPDWDSRYLFIPKKLWLKKERRFLTFREILQSGNGKFHLSEEYERLGIEAIENTQEEITALAVEMDERVKGAWRTSENDEDLQNRFKSLFKPSELNKVFLSRIGTEFLRQNQSLLY